TDMPVIRPSCETRVDAKPTLPRSPETPPLKPGCAAGAPTAGAGEPELLSGVPGLVLANGA
ncbi:MAG TPA: hypothetical protein VFA32_05520, partial [Dehalococcoidia bacterium]|nr:hypothetical protein [Dehalococcoidia bacterium]